jgi:ferredoxin
MKVTIDRNECTSCGTCWDTCPAFFEENPDDHFSRVIEKFRLNGNNAGGTPTKDLEACVTEAADLCPVSIITLET